jgi:glycosyltransferase involved in cell wall biosynthesis
MRLLQDAQDPTNMNFISITYTQKPDFDQPLAWLHRVRAYIGILEALSQSYSVISIDRINYQGDLFRNGVQHHFPDFGEGRFSAALKLNRRAGRMMPDIVLVQGMIFPLQVILLRIQLGRKVKILVQNHAERPGRRHHRLLQTIADLFIDAYLFTAKEMGADWVRKHIIRRPEKIRQVMEASSVFSPGDSRTARTRLGVTGDPVFLWVGRLNDNKDPLTVVKAFLSFADRHSTARLYMLFHSRELQPDIEDLLDATPGGREKIVLVGEKTHTEMEEWYHAADYIISGSHYEGSGIAVCEAMSCGCIPVLTDILSFRMMTGDGACGILYPAGNAGALALALEQITAENTTIERQRVLQQFRKELSFGAIADRIQAIAASL